jgi:hypothetical protein
VTAIGHTIWAIAEGYILAEDDTSGRGSDADDTNRHETICLLNPGDDDANVEVTAYFADREPVGPYRLQVPARRTLPVWSDDLGDPGPILHDADFATVVRSDVPIVVQHTRLDSRQSENALLSTMSMPVP